jgi:beta-glucosidase
MTTPTPWWRDGRLHFALGVENTFVPQAGPGARPLDEYELTEHYRFWHEDLGRAREVGAEMLRWGVPWHRVNPSPGRWDWSWVDQVVERFSDLGIRPLIDLLHYGTPTWLEGEFAHPDYPKIVADYAVRVAERYSATVTDYTPVNEPMIHALFSGAYGYWPPHLTGDRGLVTMVRAIGEGFVRTQRAIREVLGPRATFVHVDATLRYAGDVAGEHRDFVARLNHQRFLVEDLVTGRVGDDHPLVGLLRENGLGDPALAWFAENKVKPDVMGVNYYPQHSTEVFEEGVHHSGGFADPRPTQDDGVAGLVESLLDYERRYGAPVMVTETCVTGTVEERIAWLDASVAAVHAMRRAGHRVVGYTWWPLFDMYEWTYRHQTGPRSESLLPMGLYDLIEGDTGLQRRRNAVADRFRHHATAAPEPSGEVAELISR